MTTDRFTDAALRRSILTGGLPLLLAACLLLAAAPSPGAPEAEISPEEAEILKPAEGAKAAAPSAPAGRPARRMQQFEDVVEAGKAAGLRIVTEQGFFDYDEDQNAIYANERTKITYKDMVLEADQFNLDLTLYEVQAAGNVTFVGPNTELQAERLIYDFRKNTGKAFKARGRYEVLRVQHAEDEGDVPSFERLSEDESIFRKATATTSQFTVPTYHVKAREILIYHNDRVFLKGATLYVRGIPILYLPVYSKSLREGTPWQIRGGYKSDMGAWVRLGYVMRHSSEEPSLEDDKMRQRSKGEVGVFADYFTQRGPGGGLNYEYDLDYGRHRGYIEGDALYDSDRRVTDEEDLDRYQVLMRHRSELTDELTWTLNADYFSDPEFYDEILDLFRDDERKRVMERRVRTALTYAQEQYIARLSVELKDRIGRKRIRNFSQAENDNLDFDEQPDVAIKNRTDKGIPTDRWGDVAARAPQITVSTAWKRLLNLPFFYHTDLNIFNNLDSGLNGVSDNDDAYVRGFDWYNALMWRWRLTERTTLLAQIGAGAGMAMREDEEYGYNFAATPAAPATLLDERGLPYMTFIGPETFLIGTKPFNLDKDVKDGFVYGDALLRLRHRINDALTFDATYKYRKTNDDFLGDWYAQMGYRRVRDDLYNFRLRENSLQAALRYRLLRPRLSAALTAFRNLIDSADLFPNELVSAHGVSGQWTSTDNTRALFSGIGVAETQMYHTSDPLEYTDSSLRWNVGGSYRPVSGLWWTQISSTFRDQLDHAPSARREKRYTEGEDERTIDLLLGGRVGPKWEGQVSASWNSRYNSMRRLTFGFQRDLCDALLLMMLSFENELYRDDNDAADLMSQVDFRFALRPKLPNSRVQPTMPGITVIRPRTRTPEVSNSLFN